MEPLAPNPFLTLLDALQEIVNAKRKRMSDTGRSHRMTYYWIRMLDSSYPVIAERSQISGKWYIPGIDQALDESNIEVIRPVEPLERKIQDTPKTPPHDSLKGRTLLVVKTASGTLSYTVQQPDEALAMATRMAAKEPVDIFDGHTQERLVSLGQGQMINNLIPDDVLEAMADAMLDPPLRIPGKVPNADGNKIRIRVLSRALAAAEELGWVMVRAEIGK
jgi:hypothetical protein